MIPIHQLPDGGLLLPIKAVPGSRQTTIVGPLGARLKVRVAAPPEHGKANHAIAELLAAALGLRAAQVRVVDGLTSPEKSVRIDGITAELARQRLGI